MSLSSFPNDSVSQQLLGALIGLARATDGNPTTAATADAAISGLLALTPEAALTSWDLHAVLEQVRLEKHALVPDCAVCMNPCGHNDDYSADLLLTAPAEILEKKLEILRLAQSLAAHLTDAPTPEKCFPLYKALFVLGEDWEPQELQEVIDELTQLPG